MVAACFVPAADLHFRSFLCRVICGLRLLRRSVSPHRSPSEETTGYQGICTGCLCGLLRLQQSLGTGDPDRQGRPPQATLALAGMSRTGLIPGLLRSSLLLPETLSLDPRLCLYAGPGGKRLESQPHRDVHTQPASQTSLPSYPPEPPALYFSDAFQVANRLLLAMELLTEDLSCRGLKAPAQRTGAPPWDPQHRGELEEVSLPPTPASLLGAGQGQLPRGREPSKAPGNLVGLGRLSSGGLGAVEAVGSMRDP